jgi:hypothetical protein
MNSTEIDVTLDRLMFTQNSFVETILVTKNLDGTFNPAPMGVIRKGKLLEIRPYKSSKTYKNLVESTRLSINLTNDPLLFLKTSFKNEFDEGKMVTDWILNGSDATLLAEKVAESDFSQLQAAFTLEPINITISNNMPQVFSRGRAEAIEAIIHTTRIKVFQSENKEDKVKELLEKMTSSFNIISRVSDSSSTEVKIVQKLKSLLEKWGVEL